MPFSRQQLRVDPVAHEEAVRPGLRAAAFDRREPVTQRGGCPRDAVPGRLERSASRSHRNRALTADSYRRARIVIKHVLAPELAAPLTLLAGRYA
jgi:hypothetical protein